MKRTLLLFCVIGLLGAFSGTGYKISSSVPGNSDRMNGICRLNTPVDRCGEGGKFVLTGKWKCLSVINCGLICSECN
ncbi:MAG: hypothetical protein ACLUDU_13340 [Butyricimonas faecihominis]